MLFGWTFGSGESRVVECTFPPWDDSLRMICLHLSVFVHVRGGCIPMLSPTAISAISKPEQAPIVFLGVE